MELSSMTSCLRSPNALNRRACVCFHCHWRVSRPSSIAPVHSRTLRTRPQRINSTAGQDSLRRTRLPDNSGIKYEDGASLEFSDRQVNDIQGVSDENESRYKNTPTKIATSLKSKNGYQNWGKMARMTPAQLDEIAAQQYHGFVRPSHETHDEDMIENIVRQVSIEANKLRQNGQSLERMYARDDNVVENLGEETIHQDDGVDEAWRETPFADTDVKFAVLKRSCQLLGTRLPDPAIDSINNAGDFVQALARKPKATSLQNEMINRGVFDGLKNVTIGRQTQKQRDQEVGSLKVMREELSKMRLLAPKQRAWALGE